MANDIRYVINRTIIIDIYPLHYFRIFSQPEKSNISRGSTEIFICLLADDRSQPLTNHFFFSFCIGALLQLNTKCYL